MFATFLLSAWVHFDEDLTFIVTVVAITFQREACAGDPLFVDGVPVGVGSKKLTTTRILFEQSYN